MTMTSVSGEFHTGSFWIPAPPPPLLSLEGASICDVVIIGGGYVGLNAALRLKEAGLDAVVLEQDFCGAGASGRNAGHIGSTIGKDIYTCLKTFGPKKGLALARLGDAAVEHFKSQGLRFINEEPKILENYDAGHGQVLRELRVCFVDPRTTHGVLIEVAEWVF